MENLLLMMMLCALKGLYIYLFDSYDNNFVLYRT
jgi:hypothetical protein